MSLTVADIITNVNSMIGDTSNDRVSAAERLQYVTESTIWLQESLENETQNNTYVLQYYDNVHYYKVTSSLADLLEGADLRRSEKDQYYTFAHKSAREMAEEIGQRFDESSWGIERHDGDKYLVVNHRSKYPAQTVADCDSISAGGGAWAVDAVNSDATNLTIDTNEYKQGTASFNFDITVAQSGNNRATLINSTLTQLDLSSVENLGSWVFWIYVPNVTYFTSVTLYWGIDSSNYWSATASSDVNGSTWVAGWNRVSIPWNGAIKTSSPTSNAIDYLRIDYNYSASQANATDFRLDDLTIVRPEPLTLYYISWNVGTDTTGVTHKTAFTVTTDIPYFSGQYDQYKFAVAHKAASLIFNSFGLENDSTYEANEAILAMRRAKGIIPSAKNEPQKTFKVRGVNLTRYKNRSRGNSRF